MARCCAARSLIVRRLAAESAAVVRTGQCGSQARVCGAGIGGSGAGWAINAIGGGSDLRSRFEMRPAIFVWRRPSLSRREGCRTVALLVRWYGVSSGASGRDVVVAAKVPPRPLDECDPRVRVAVRAFLHGTLSKEVRTPELPR